MQPQVGDLLEGKITGITKFGVFVEIGENVTGMVHISEVARTFVNEIRDFVKEGDTVKVLYSKENHAEATIKTGGFIAPIITGGLTVAFMIPVIIYIVMKAKGLLNF